MAKKIKIGLASSNLGHKVRFLSKIRLTLLWLSGVFLDPVIIRC